MRFTLHNHQRSHKIALRPLRAAVLLALPHCVAAARSGSAPLLTLTEIEASIVSDPAIAKVHADFLDDPSPTDVITFQHGEIIVSADTAARYVAASRKSGGLQRELLLYLVHGLLHLAGWDDHDPTERKAMHRLQSRILRLVSVPAD